MVVKLFRKEDGVVRNIADSFSVLNLLTALDCENVSVAVCSAENHDEITKNTSDRAYYILEGEMMIEGKIAKQGNVVYVPANSNYGFSGTFKAVVINSPAFKKKNESISKIGTLV